LITIIIPASGASEQSEGINFTPFVLSLPHAKKKKFSHMDRDQLKNLKKVDPLPKIWQKPHGPSPWIFKLCESMLWGDESQLYG
jgi:hypothetical protein